MTVVKQNVRNVVTTTYSDAIDLQGIGKPISGQLLVTVDTPSAVVFDDDDIVTSDDSITFGAAHGLISGQEIEFTTADTLPTGLDVSTSYFVIKIDATTIKVAASLADVGTVTTVSFDNDGVGAHAVAPVAVSFEDSDITDGTDTIADTGHGLVTGTVGQVTTTGSLPTGITALTNYYVIRVDANSFRLATSLALAIAGTAMPIGADGSGVHTFTPTTVAFDDDDITTGDDYINKAYGFTTGSKVQISTATTLPSPIAAVTDYYVIDRGGDAFGLSLTLAGALAGNYMPITADGAGDHTVTSVALAGGSVKTQRSNDNVNWTDQETGQNITATGTIWFSISTPPSYRFMRYAFAATAGRYRAEIHTNIQAAD